MTQADGMIDPIDREVGRYLLEHKVLDREKIQEAVAYSKKEGCGFRRALLALDLVDLEFLQRFLPKDAGEVRPEDLARISAQAEAASKAPARPGPAPDMPSGAVPVPKARKADAGPGMHIPTSAGSGKPKRLGEYLLEAEVVNDAQLEQALDYAKENNVFLGTALVSLRMLDEETLSKFIIRQRQDAQKGRKGRQTKLGEILVQRKLVSDDQLQQALEMSVKEGRRLGEVLLEKGFLTENDLALALSEQLLVPMVNLKRNPPDPAVAAMVSKKLVQKHRALPYRKEGKLLTIAMVDPLNFMAIDDFKAMTQCDALPVIVTEKDFNEAVKTFLGGEEEELLEWFAGGKGDEESSSGADAEAIDQAPIVNLVNKILGQACKKSVSDIHVDPREDHMVVRFRLDGELREHLKAPLEMAAPVAARFKVMANMNVAETRLPQDGKFRLKIAGNVVDFRVSVLPLIGGEKIVLRILDQSKAKVKLKELGLAPLQFKWFTDDGIFRPNGIVLVTGPTGSGKTSTLYAGLMAIASPNLNIHTVEDPVEFTLPGVTQVQTHAEWGLDFAAVLKSFLRQDPDVILLGEIRDTETARIALKAAMTGHLVLSTLHTNDAISTIDRFLSMGIDRFLMATALKVVLAQRLVSKVCGRCAKDDPEGRTKLLEQVGFPQFLLEQAEIESVDQVMCRKGEGCEECEGSGLKGRIGIFEVIRFDEDIAEMIVNGNSNKEVYDYCRTQGMISLRDAALIRAAQGLIPLEEVFRVTVPPPSDESRTAIGNFLEEDQGVESPAVAQKELTQIREVLEGLGGLAKGSGGDSGAKAAGRILELFKETWGEGDLTRPQAKLGMERLGHYLKSFEGFSATPRKAIAETDLAALVKERIVDRLPALGRLAMLLNEKKVDIASIQVMPSFDGLGKVSTDPGLLGNVLEALVLNALQAMPQGGRIKVVGRRAGDRVEILVADTGPGLAEGLLEAAKQPFHTTRPYGLGLGIPLAEKVAGVLGGSFELRSVVGKGTVATIRIPAGD